MQKCETQESNPCAPKFEDKTLQETLQQDAHAEMGLGETCPQAPSKGQRPRSTPLPMQK